MDDAEALSEVLYTMIEQTLGVHPTDTVKVDKTLRRLPQAERREVMELMRGRATDTYCPGAEEEATLARLEIEEFEENSRAPRPSSSHGRTPHGLSWSTDAPRLRDMLSFEDTSDLRGGPGTSRLARKAFLKGFFTDLRFPNLRIRRIDEEMLEFRSVEDLALSGNDISVLENVPSSLKGLHAYGNSIGSIRLWKEALPQCLHLGLGYNDIRDVSMVPAAAPQLRILDLSFNSLEDLPSICSVLRALPQLEHGMFEGNPAALAYHYRPTLIQAASDKLETLDDIPVNRRSFLRTVARTMPQLDARLREEKSPLPTLPAPGSEDGMVTRVVLRVALESIIGVPSPFAVPGFADWVAQVAEESGVAAPPAAGKKKASGKAGKKDDGKKGVSGQGDIDGEAGDARAVAEALAPRWAVQVTWPNGTTTWSHKFVPPPHYWCVFEGPELPRSMTERLWEIAQPLAPSESGTRPTVEDGGILFPVKFEAETQEEPSKALRNGVLRRGMELELWEFPPPAEDEEGREGEAKRNEGWEREGDAKRDGDTAGWFSPRCLVRSNVATLPMTEAGTDPYTLCDTQGHVSARSPRATQSGRRSRSRVLSLPRATEIAWSRGSEKNAPEQEMARQRQQARVRMDAEVGILHFGDFSPVSWAAKESAAASPREEEATEKSGRTGSARSQGKKKSNR